MKTNMHVSTFFIWLTFLLFPNQIHIEVFLPGPNKLFLLPKFKAPLSLLKTLLMYKFFLFLSFYQKNYFNQKLLYL